MAVCVCVILWCLYICEKCVKPLVFMYTHITHALLLDLVALALVSSVSSYIAALGGICYKFERQTCFVITNSQL